MERHQDFLDKLEESRNGHFLLEERLGRAMLQVFAPGGKGTPVRLTDVMARVSLFGLRNFDKALIESVVEDADGQAHDIGEWVMPDPVDAKLEVQIAEDKFSVEILVRPPVHGGRAVTDDFIRSTLGEHGVVFGILDEQVAKIVAHYGPDNSKKPESRKPSRAVIARGKRPVPGKNGTVEHEFNPNPRARPEVKPGERTGERVDFRNLNVIQSCEADALLARITDSVPGQPGMNVLGEVAHPPEVEGARLHMGRNTRLSDDQKELYANIAGQVRVEDRPDSGSARIDVEEVLRLESADYSTGHIDFPGTVVLAGTVLDGFEVNAEGDIVIEKSVGNVRLKAKGDIILSGGIVSRGQASVQAGGDLYARFIQSSTAFSAGSIFIEEAAMHARLTAARDILIEGGRGELIGGTAVCGRLLRVRKLGARNETSTRITVGLSPEVMEQLQALEDEYLEKSATLQKVEMHIAQIEEARKRGKQYEENQDETFEKLKVIRGKYETALANLDEQRESLYARIKPNPSAAVEAEMGAEPGVEIHFGAGIKRYLVERRPIHTYCRFIIEENSIVLRHSDL